MTPKLTYEKATSEDSKFLSEVAQKSKQNWGYPDDWMQLWQEDLTLKPDYIHQNSVFKIYDQDRFIGFYAIVDAEICELDHFWLKAENQRKGYGTLVFEHVRQSVSKLGKSVFQLVAEPNAKGFYDKMNGIVSSRFESKIQGRFLEIYRFEVLPKAD